MLKMHLTSHCTGVVFIVAFLVTAENLTLNVMPEGMNVSQCQEYIRNHSHGNSTVLCESLSYYVKNSTEYIKNNTLMVFLSGIHYLSNIMIVIRVENVSLEGYPLQANSIATIQCANLHNSGIRFIGSKDIHISQLTLISCGTNDSMSTEDDMITHSALYFGNIINLSLNNVIVMNSSGYGINCHSNCGTIKIESSLFYHNQGDHYIGGNSRFYYGDCNNVSTNILSIQHSNFTNGLSCRDYMDEKNVSGIELMSFCSDLEVIINKSTVKGNLGGNMKFVMKDFLTQIWKIFITDSVIGDGSSYKGAGLLYTSKLYSSDFGKCSKDGGNLLQISNTNFTGNSVETLGGAIYISLFNSDCKPSNIEITKCSFVKNSVISRLPFYGKGAAIYVMKHSIPSFYELTMPVYTVNITEAHFYDNYVTRSNHSSVLEVIEMENIKLKNSDFLNNRGTAISMKSSNLIVTGTIVFKNNTATNGGALKFCESSSLFINNDTTVIFHNNHASKTGGAIFADQSCIDQSTPCFFQPNVNFTTEVDNLKGENHMNLVFRNNYAQVAGDAIYGGNVDSCYTYRTFTSEHTNETGFYLSKAIMNSTFIFRNDFDNGSLISSDAYEVYFCGESYDVTTINITAMPGQTFSIYVKGTGQREGFAPAVIAAQLNGSYNNTNLIQLHKYGPSFNCTLLNLTIITDQIDSIIPLKLSVQQNEPEAIYNSTMFRYASVYIANCSWGFQLIEGRCECATILKNFSMRCNIDQQVLQKPAGPVFWVGCEHQNNKTCFDETILITKDCGRHNYCDDFKVYITAKNWTGQCNENRTGIACGHCPDGHSLPLGTFHCKSCSNAYLSLVLLYLSAGIILVLLLTSLNLTVANGSINGFLLYANFIYINRDAFFSKFVHGDVLNIFIAWINIDLGIEVCFYNGLDAYQKTWLEFLYVFYLWILQTIIILMCRKYVFFTRICGRNVTKVMATLILLCISKTCQVIADTTEIIYMYTPSHQSSPIYIWSLDGSIQFLSLKHMILLVVALLVGVLLLGFVGCLLFIQILRKIPAMKIIKKLLPFFEAYSGPCNHNYAFWPGFLMLTRGMAALIYGISVNKSSQLGKTMGIIVSVIIISFLSPHGVYKKWSLNLLELSFMLNLLILFAICYFQPSIHTRFIHHLSFLIAVSVFLTYNFWSPLNKVVFKCVKSLHKRFSQQKEQEGTNSLSNVVTCSEVTVTPRTETERSPLLFQPPPRVDYDLVREQLVEQ